MSKYTKYLAFLLLIIANSSIIAQTADPVKKADNANKQKAAAGMLDKEVSEFLVKAADARMMDKIEGAMAMKSGTTAAVRSYGQQMVKDQTMLLGKIKQLAASRHISLPMQISSDKEDGRKDLGEKKDIDFDKKFISMMKIDHERDVKMFSKAIELRDAGVSAFAKKYLPLIEKHLAGINALKENQH